MYMYISRYISHIHFCRTLAPGTNSLKDNRDRGNNNGRYKICIKAIHETMLAGIFTYNKRHPSVHMRFMIYAVFSVGITCHMFHEQIKFLVSLSNDKLPENSSNYKMD